ncbi:MAG TPA: saccharopine dehydrogenase NADP-binding domain-containing protein [Blastocatellia bacterium]|nr:saccharopine dehydrogenase NADP-binding domain-containing protein [Blastocatellia bacterium]
MPMTFQPSSLSPDSTWSEKPDRKVAVFGAAGHTGRFVVSELRRRGLTPILSGRDAAKLNACAEAHPGSEARVASIDDPASLDRAISGAAAVINCAGPFIDTAAPLIETAIRGRIHYLDVTAEQRAALGAFERFADTARDAGVVIAPAMAFYGGLGDLLATAAMGDWPDADEICVAVALDSWKPTRGTRLTGKRNTGPRFVFSNSKLEFLADPAPRRKWNFPAPFGAQDVVELGFSEIITISRHLRTPEIHAFMNLAPITDIRNPDTPEPVAADESGRSSQTFLMEAVARKESEVRRAIARGRDIYAITAPIVVEAAERILDGRFKATGVVAAGELFDAQDFLMSLRPDVSLE